MNSDALSSLSVIFGGLGLLLVIWLPTFGITFAVMNNRHKKKVASREGVPPSGDQVGQDVAVAGAVSLGLALAISFGVVMVLGVCAVVLVVGFFVAACGGH